MTKRQRSKLGPGIEQLGSGSFRATVSTPLSGRIRGTFATLDEAVAWRANERIVRSASAGRNARRLAPNERRKLRVGDYFERWLVSNPDLDPVSTIPMYRSYFANHIDPGIGNVAVVDVNARALDQFAAEMRATSGLAQSTQARIMGIVSAMLGSAVREGIIATNPAHEINVKRKTIKAGEIRALERWEFDKIVANASGIWPDVFLILAHTGLRWSELAGLQVWQVDERTHTIRVSQQLNRDGTIKPATKDRDPRTVGVSARAWAALAPYVEDRDPTAFVFTGERGAPLRYGNVRRRVWQPLVESLGIRDRGGKLVGVHALRHSCASWLAHAGVAPIDVMAHMGHESLRTTMRYFHNLDGAASRVAAAFDD